MTHFDGDSFFAIFESIKHTISSNIFLDEVQRDFIFMQITYVREFYLLSVGYTVGLFIDTGILL